jgi:hypothetical protein
MVGDNSRFGDVRHIVSICPRKRAAGWARGIVGAGQRSCRRRKRCAAAFDYVGDGAISHSVGVFGCRDRGARLSESHADCAASISLRLAARRAPARNMFSSVKNGVSGAAGGDLPIAAWSSITRGLLTCAKIIPLSARRSELLVRRRMAEGPAPEPAVAHGFARGFLVFNLPD